jgi:hypothetical protein
MNEEGAAAIAESMSMMDSLKKICMENNNIKDKGVIALSRTLEENDTLLSLYLENN